jgi:hypothetical protein
VALIKFDVFGRIIVVERLREEWLAFDVSGDGKRRRADGIIIPGSLAEAELATWLDDLCHEYATGDHPSVRRL